MSTGRSCLCRWVFSP